MAVRWGWFSRGLRTHPFPLRDERAPSFSFENCRICRIPCSQAASPFSYLPPPSTKAFSLLERRGQQDLPRESTGLHSQERVPPTTWFRKMLHCQSSLLQGPNKYSCLAFFFFFFFKSQYFPHLTQNPCLLGGKGWGRGFITNN